MVLLRKQTEKQKTEILAYSAFIDEFIKFAMVFGTTMGFAFSEVREKRDAMMKNIEVLKQQGFVKDNTDDVIYIEDFCKIEIKHKLTHLNGANGAKHFSNKAP